LAPFNKLYIVGCGAPQRKRDGEVWCPNYKPPCKITRAFQIHQWKYLDQKEKDWLRVCHVPIYVPSALEVKRSLNPQARIYPKALMAYGPFCSSFDYMMAMAISEDFKEIILERLFLQRGTLRERLIEHTGLMYWIGHARGLGIRVSSHQSYLGHYPFKYGVQYIKEQRWGVAEVKDALGEPRIDEITRRDLRQDADSGTPDDVQREQV